MIENEFDRLERNDKSTDEPKAWSMFLNAYPSLLNGKDASLFYGRDPSHCRFTLSSVISVLIPRFSSMNLTSS
jgi:hypothetical protein